MKKYAWIVALLAALSLAIFGIGCGGGGDGGGDDEIVYDTFDLIISPTTGDDTDEIEDMKAADTAAGKGWIIGEEFAKVKGAKAGSLIRLTVTGTANLNWDSIGAVGFQNMKLDKADERVDFKPKSGGTYTVDVKVSDVFKCKDADKAYAISVNIWGDHKIDKVQLLVPQGEVGPADPEASDFNISDNLVQYISDGIKAVTVTPKNGMSQGAITVYYEGQAPTVYAKSATLPSAIGKYTVTFDVAAATGFNAATGLAAGTLTILAAPIAPLIVFDGAYKNGATTNGTIESGKIKITPYWQAAQYGNPARWEAGLEITFSSPVDISAFNKMKYSLTGFDDALKQYYNQLTWTFDGNAYDAQSSAKDPDALNATYELFSGGVNWGKTDWDDDPPDTTKLEKIQFGFNSIDIEVDGEWEKPGEEFVPKDILISDIRFVFE